MVKWRNTNILHTGCLLKKQAKLKLETETVAGISEEHSAATQEMLATIEDQDKNIASIFNSMKEIQTASESLEEMTRVNIV